MGTIVGMIAPNKVAFSVEMTGLMAFFVCPREHYKQGNRHLARVDMD